jgi:hypothetical protein
MRCACDLRRLALSLLLVAAAPAAAEEVAVEVINASEPTLCAEKDNVTLNLVGSEVRRFIVEAVHPAYIGTIVADRSVPDFRNCDMSNDPVHRFEPRRVTLHESVEWQLVGLTFPTFWRASDVTVQVKDRVERGLHLLQLWTRFQERAEEVLVLYPMDGYWRARPLPPPHLRWSAYGSSFLVGPVGSEERPLVDLRAVVFEPATRTFRLDFVQGGSATVRLDHLDQERLALEVALDPPVVGRPFAALRSMYVTETNADVAQVAWRGKGAPGWRQAPLTNLKRANAVELWAGRRVPSRHNTSAPDMVFRDFTATPR